MNHHQLRAFLAKHKLAQEGAAKLVGISGRTMRRYCSGEQPLPWAVELALRYAVTGKAPRPNPQSPA